MYKDKRKGKTREIEGVGRVVGGSTKSAPQQVERETGSATGADLSGIGNGRRDPSPSEQRFAVERVGKLSIGSREKLCRDETDQQPGA